MVTLLMLVVAMLSTPCPSNAHGTEILQEQTPTNSHSWRTLFAPVFLLFGRLLALPPSMFRSGQGMGYVISEGRYTKLSYSYT